MLNLFNAIFALENIRKKFVEKIAENTIYTLEDRKEELLQAKCGVCV